MDDVFAAQLMTSDLVTARPDDLVEDVAGTLLEEGIGSVVVVDDDDRLAGILTSTDFVRIVAERKPKDRTHVERYMTTDVVTAGPQDPVAEVGDRMVDHGIHHVPVVDDDGVVVGMLSTTDLAAYVSSADARQTAD
jgi:CBS domain-containing protein